jgi:hypothetical protein
MPMPIRTAAKVEPLKTVSIWSASMERMYGCLAILNIRPQVIKTYVPKRIEYLSFSTNSGFSRIWGSSRTEKQDAYNVESWKFEAALLQDP